MPGSLSIVLPLVLAGVLIASGIAKLRRPDDLSSWAELGVPRALRREWLRRVHPWAELLLALALAALGSVLGLAAALIAVALMGAYLWLVWAAHRRVPDASCACFGSRAPITRRTIVRNVWLVLLAVASVAVIWTNPPFGGALAAIRPGDIGWIVGAVVAAITAALVVASDAAAVGEVAADTASVPGTGTPAPEADEELDYIRMRTPAVPVTLADGTVASLRELTATRPALLLAVSPDCGACSPVIERIGEWRALLPEVDIRFLLTDEPATSALADTTEPQTLHDANRYVRDSIGHWYTPTAVLLGADGLLAGGPVTGYQAIVDLVSDVHESLLEVRAVVER